MGTPLLRFALLGAFLLAVGTAVLFAVPDYWAIFLPETGSAAGALAAPCPAPGMAGRDTILRDQRLGISLRAPAGSWRAGRSPDATATTWWNGGEGVEVRLHERFPGRPRIETRMHGIAQLERCREAAGGDSSWIASARATGWNRYVVIALHPLGGGKWLGVTAVTDAGTGRQQEWLGAVRSARLHPRPGPPEEARP